MATEQCTVPPPPPLPPRQNIGKVVLSPGTTTAADTPVSDYLSEHWGRLTGSDDSLHIISTFRSLKPVAQNGPQCGIVALSMAAQLLQPAPAVSVDCIFDMAKAMNFTAKGEMFSVESMKLLAERALQCRARVLRCGLEQTVAEILRHLLRGNPVLVPYDSDGNYEPCLKRGRSAHWAVLHGFCAAVPRATATEVAGHLHADPHHERLHHVMPEQQLPPGYTEELVASSSNAFVYARQGKSRRYGLWNLEALLASNRNLIEVTTKHDASQFVLPDGGPAEGLAGKVLLLW